MHTHKQNKKFLNKILPNLFLKQHFLQSVEHFSCLPRSHEGFPLT